VHCPHALATVLQLDCPTALQSLLCRRAAAQQAPVRKDCFVATKLLTMCGRGAVCLHARSGHASTGCFRNKHSGWQATGSRLCMGNVIQDFFSLKLLAVLRAARSALRRCQHT
jgi:hypothetical protein